MQISLHQNSDKHIDYDEIGNNEETYVKQRQHLMVVFDRVLLHSNKIDSIEHLIHPTLCRRNLKQSR